MPQSFAVFAKGAEFAAPRLPLVLPEPPGFRGRVRDLLLLFRVPFTIVCDPHPLRTSQISSDLLPTSVIFPRQFSWTPDDHARQRIGLP